MTLVALFAGLAIGVAPAVATESKTFFELLERAWAVGEIRLSAAIEHRGGRLLVFPAHIVDLIHARVGKPRTILVVHEHAATGAEPVFKEGDRLLAAIGILPEHSYWRDNLPATKRHEILGGRRYAFKDSELDGAKEMARAYTATLDDQMPLRARRQASVMVEALLSDIPVLAEDAMRTLTRAPRLARDIDKEAQARLSAFLADESAEAALRGRLARAAGGQGADAFVPVLEQLSLKDDAVAAPALAALDDLGRERPTTRLTDLLGAATAALRVYAAEALGKRAAGDAPARTAAVTLLLSDAEMETRLAAARGLGASGSPVAIDALAAAMDRGDGATRTAAIALAKIGGPRAHTLLKQAITGGAPETMVAAVMAMVQLRDECEGCLAFLAEQHRNHDEQAVRETIAVMLELHKKHEH